MRGRQWTITVDNNPFSSVEAYHVEARRYKMKGKEMDKNEDVQSQYPSDVRWQASFD